MNILLTESQLNLLIQEQNKKPISLQQIFNEILSIQEDFDVIEPHNIIIEPFENEITNREAWEQNNWSLPEKMTEKEIMKLNLLFGTLKERIVYRYDFNINEGGFGKERINFKGDITKHSEYHNQQNTFFIIDGIIRIKLQHDSGIRRLTVKTNNFNQVLNFFNSFENNLNYSIE